MSAYGAAARQLRLCCSLVVSLFLACGCLFSQTPTSTQRAAAGGPVPSRETPHAPSRNGVLDLAAPYRLPTLPPLSVESTRRSGALLRNGQLYLSLFDAIALAIENNLDVEVSRYNLSLAATDVQRAAGGGTLRGLDYSVTESPTGVGGPGSPLLNSAASTVTTSTPTVNDLTSLNILSSTPANLSVQSISPYATGPNLPLLDPSIVGQTGFFSRSNTTSLLAATPGANSLTNTSTLHFITNNYALVKGFGYGTQLEVDVNNAAQALYSDRSRYNPFSTPNTSVTVSQPLLRGRGTAVNLRFLRIAAINQRISRLLFYQQLINTVYGISRLYYDLVSLNENAQVKRESLTAARKLLEDERAQVEQGTLAPLDLTRAQSLVSSSELDLIQAQGLVDQQQVILKTQLARRGSADPVLATAQVIPTDPIAVPNADENSGIDALVQQAMQERADLLQAGLQVQSNEIALRGSQNATRAELDVVGNYQTKGSAESPYLGLGTTGNAQLIVPPDLAVAGLRLSRIYQAGIQLNLPLRNRVAQADAARDLIQLRQSQARTQILTNQVREQVENAVIALRTARTALNAAIQSRVYQEQLVSAEQDKLSVGASTSFLVIQQSSYLAQARSTEVAARSVWVKARVALDRALGTLLDKNQITFADAVKGELPSAPAH